MKGGVDSRCLCAVLTLIWAAITCQASQPLYPPMEPPFTEIVKDGEARAIIVPLAQPAQRPAEELNEYIRKMSGVTLPVVAPSQQTPGFRILIGDPAAATEAGIALPVKELPRDGFAIVCEGDTLALVGQTQLSQFYAVDAFLEKYQDVRWFYPLPGTWGEHVPKRSTVRVGRISDVEGPSFPFRYVSKSGLWARRNKQNVFVGATGECKVWGVVHTYASLIPADEYFDAHPEFFPLIGGKRRRPESKGQISIQLCTSNPQVIEEVAKRVIAVTDLDPDFRVIGVDPMDGAGFCQCEACLALDEEGVGQENLYTRRLLIFTNEVAERVARKHPEVMIKFLAYRTYMSPPADPDFKVHPNVLIQFARGSGLACDNHALTDTSCPFNHEGGSVHLEAWRRLTSNICLYEYYLRTAWENLPWPMVHAIREDIPYFRKLGLRGVYTQFTPRSLATNGMNYYVAAKLLWDADLDVDTLLSDFYEKCYGEASDPMRRYHEALEERFAQSGEHVLVEGVHGAALRLFSSEFLDELDGTVTEAESVAVDAKVKRRVQMMRVAQTYTRLAVEEYLRPMSGKLTNPNHCWSGGPFPGFLDPALVGRIEKEYTPVAARIRKFLGDNAGLAAVDHANAEADILKPGKVVMGLSAVNCPRWPGRRDYRRGGEMRNKAGWLAARPEARPAAVGDAFSLWIYGHDFDSDGEESEHAILLKGAGGTDVGVGGIAPVGKAFDKRNACVVLGPFSSGEYVHDRKITVTITNPSGKWWASYFWAIYVMPGEISATHDEATQRALNDIEWLRSKALGFAEMTYGGFQSLDGTARSYTIEIPQ